MDLEPFGVRRVLYRLPGVIAASDVLFLEGEKDADTGKALGITSTSRLANYPCILVGDELWNYLGWAEAQRAASPHQKLRVYFDTRSAIWSVRVSD
jgi:hypothetical protein